MSGFKFHLAADCTECGDTVYADGVALSLLVHPDTGLPVVPVDMFAHESFPCPECGVSMEFGDMEPYVEPVDDEDDEDGEPE